MNIFYISHVPIYSNYGAGTSLRNHINILREQYKNEVKIIVFYRISFSEILSSLISSYRFFKEKKILTFPIFTDWDLTYDYDHSLIFSKRFKFFLLKEFLYKISAKIIKIFIKIFNPKIIHLNSHILLSFFKRIQKNSFLKKTNAKTICHIRDIISKLTVNEISNFKNIDQFICIDNASRESLLRNIVFAESRHVIIPNPFQANKSIKEFDIQIQINDYDLILGFVGTLIKDKGVDFIIDSLATFKTNKKIALIVVGDGLLYNSLVEKSSTIKNVDIFISGLVESLSDTNFYEKIDLLIRGDKTFRTGRTVFEALYQGKDVLIPKVFTNNINEPQLEFFKKSVYLYQARDSESLISTLKVFIKKHRKKNTKIILKNNFAEYAKKISKIYFDL